MMPRSNVSSLMRQDLAELLRREGIDRGTSHHDLASAPRKAIDSRRLVLDDHDVGLPMGLRHER